jgi:hypothetical protein
LPISCSASSCAKAFWAYGQGPGLGFYPLTANKR